MKQEVQLLFDNYKNAVDLAEKYLDISDLDEMTKNGILHNYEYAFRKIEEEPTKGVIKFFTKELCELWSFWLAIWVELFWKEIEVNHVQLKRTDSVLKIIERKRFLGIGEAMMFNKNWEQVVASGFVSRYSQEQISFINELLRKDKEKRLDLLIKSLRNRRVNSSDYLKYGEAIAYFTNGRLFCKHIEDEEISLYFSKDELELLSDIW